MPQPTPRDLAVVDPLLTDISFAFWQSTENFLFGRVFPIIEVGAAAGKYLEFPKGAHLRDKMPVRPLGGRAARAGYGVALKDYVVEERALEHPIDDRLRAPGLEGFDLDEAGTQFLTMRALVAQERLWAERYFGPGIWSTDRVGDPTPVGDEFLHWSDDNSDPVGYIRGQARTAGLAAGGVSFNTLVLGAEVFDILVDHPDIKDRIKYTQIADPDMALLAKLLRLDNVFVAAAVFNAATEGAADDLQWVLNPKDALLVHASPRPAKNMPSAGYTFAWTGLLPGATNAMGGVIDRYREEPVLSDIIRLRIAAEPRIVSPDLGIFFDGAVV